MKQVICPVCKEEREVTYGQKWNINVGNSTGRCPKCKEGINIEGLKKGSGWNRGLKGYQKGHRPYFIAFGEDNPSWQGGITSESMKIRNSVEYALWRKAVFIRDNYTCIWCGQVGGRLCADHIKSFALYPELRFAIDNGRTLCFECHKKTDNYLSKAKKCAI